jgi:hypothetical protein
MAGAAGWTGNAFSIDAFYAFNRPLYHNPKSGHIWNSRWTPSGRSNSTVVVDNLQLDKKIEGFQWVDYARWPQPMETVPSRSMLAPEVKFAAFRAVSKETEEMGRDNKPKKIITGVYPDVDMERGVFLTREYLLDVFHVASLSGKPRNFHWIVHPIGSAAPDNATAWKPSSTLGIQLGDPKGGDKPSFSYADEHAFDAAANPWSLTALQTCAAGDPAQSKLGKGWYDREVGVRVTMLGDPGPAGTLASYARPIEAAAGKRALKKDEDPEEATDAMNSSEMGGFMIVAARLDRPATTFVALHEPFEKHAPKIDTFRTIASAPDALAVALTGKAPSPVDDRVLLRYGDKAAEAITLAAGGESFTFTGHAHLRLSPVTVTATGNITALSLKVTGTPRLVLNGKEAPARVEAGTLTFGP